MRNRGRTFRSLGLVGIAWLLSAIAAAEGGVKLFDCRIVRVCDAAGSCRDASGTVKFRMEPLAVEAAGAGRYALSYGDSRAEVRAVSDAGPFFWTIGSERDALLASAETEFLWHQLKLDNGPEATIRFLRCAVQL